MVVPYFQLWPQIWPILKLGWKSLEIVHVGDFALPSGPSTRPILLLLCHILVIWTHFIGNMTDYIAFKTSRIKSYSLESFFPRLLVKMMKQKSQDA